jgi:large subunit ribosomal protein L21
MYVMPARLRQVFPCLEEAVYAVVKTGGKQYRVEEGRSVKFDRLPGEPGESVELGEVLLMANGDDVTVGAPTIAGARIVGTIAEQGRGRKIVVFRYKAKTRSRKKTGHRQHFTRVIIDDILAAGQQPKPKQERAAAAPVEEAKPKRGRRERKPAAEAEPVISEAEADRAVAEARILRAAQEQQNPPRRRAPKAAAAPSAGDEAAADAEAAGDAETAETSPAEDSPKPKRSRKKTE